MNEHYRILGLARFDASWFQTIGTWASASAIPAEFTRCVSLNEVRARLAAGVPTSCVLVAASVRGIDRDFIAHARKYGASVIIVDDAGDRRPWLDIGAAAVVDTELERTHLVELLKAHGQAIRGEHDATEPDVHPAQVAAGRVIAVTGSGGTGASTCAIAAAQGLASVPAATPGRGAHGNAPRVLLADGKLCGELAMLHNTTEVVPTIQDVVEAHRTATPIPSEVVGQTFDVSERGYRLLLGLRHRHHWALLHERAVRATMTSLVGAFEVVIADVGADLEGDQPSGSNDIANRNVLARTIVDQADSIVVVAQSSMKGLYSGVRLIADIVATGIRVTAVVPMINQVPRQPHRRASLVRAFGQLVQMCSNSLPELAELRKPVLLPRVNVETCLRDGTMLPARLVAPIGRSLRGSLAQRRPERGDIDRAPTPVVPGELAHARLGGDR
ncbi:MAG: hypothetical protein WD576_00835 [Nitriliruptoraceae bacterium]